MPAMRRPLVNDEQAYVGDEHGIRHLGIGASGYSLEPSEISSMVYLFGETACGIVYAWHSGRAHPRMYYVDPEDRFPTCLWCAACP